MLAPDRATGTAVRERIEELMREHDVFRGQVLTFGFSEHRGNQLVRFQPRPTLSAEDVVLPPGVLETIERHMVLPADKAARLPPSYPWRDALPDQGRRAAGGWRTLSVMTQRPDGPRRRTVRRPTLLRHPFRPPLPLSRRRRRQSRRRCWLTTSKASS